MGPWKIKVAGVGAYMPRRAVSNAEVGALCGVSQDWIRSHCGVETRHWADVRGGESASWMGAQAAKEALDEAGLKPSDLDLIINASGTPEQAIPDGACLMQRQLGLMKSGIACMSVHSTCLSFVTALDVASSMMIAGRYRRVLVVSAEVCSPGLNFAQPESAVLFGDGAGAVVLVNADLGEASALHGVRFETYSEGIELTEVRGLGSRVHPNYPESRPEDHLFYMDGPKVLRMAMVHSRDFMQRLMTSCGPDWARQGIGGVDVVVPHQASAAAVRVMGMLGIEERKLVMTLEQYGNCIAASIPLTLHKAVRSQQLRRGMSMAMLGTGAGLSLAGVVMTF